MGLRVAEAMGWPQGGACLAHAIWSAFVLLVESRKQRTVGNVFAPAVANCMGG